MDTGIDEVQGSAAAATPAAAGVASAASPASSAAATGGTISQTAGATSAASDGPQPAQPTSTRIPPTRLTVAPYPKLSTTWEIDAQLVDMTSKDAVAPVDKNEIVALLDFHDAPRDDSQAWLADARMRLEALGRDPVTQEPTSAKAILICLPRVDSVTLNTWSADILELYLSGLVYQDMTIPVMFCHSSSSGSSVMDLRRAALSDAAAQLSFTLAPPSQPPSDWQRLYAKRPKPAKKRGSNVAIPAEWKNGMKEPFLPADSSALTSESLEDLLNHMNAILACQHEGLVPYSMRQKKWCPDFEYATCIWCGKCTKCYDGKTNTLFRKTIKQHVGSAQGCKATTWLVATALCLWPTHHQRIPKACLGLCC